MVNLRLHMAKVVNRACEFMDRIRDRGQTMSVSPSMVRAELLRECLPLFEALRNLAGAHFGKRALSICAAIDEFEAAIRSLAGLGGGQITEDRHFGAGNCPVCGEPIAKFPLPSGVDGHESDLIVLCRQCTQPFMAAYDKLDSDEGFGAWLILGR